MKLKDLSFDLAGMKAKKAMELNEIQWNELLLRNEGWKREQCVIWINLLIQWSKPPCAMEREDWKALSEMKRVALPPLNKNIITVSLFNQLIIRYQ